MWSSYSQFLTTALTPCNDSVLLFVLLPCHLPHLVADSGKPPALCPRVHDYHREIILLITGTITFQLCGEKYATHPKSDDFSSPHTSFPSLKTSDRRAVTPPISNLLVSNSASLQRPLRARARYSGFRKDITTE